MKSHFSGLKKSTCSNPKLTQLIEPQRICLRFCISPLNHVITRDEQRFQRAERNGTEGSTIYHSEEQRSAYRWPHCSIHTYHDTVVLMDQIVE